MNQIQYQQSLFNISCAISHINNAQNKLFRVYFATKHYNTNIDYLFQQLRNIAKRTNQEVPGILVCEDFADSRSNKPIMNDGRHAHLLFFFVDHPKLYLLTGKAQELLPAYFKEYEPKTSIARTVQYATKIDGYETNRDGVISAYAFPLDYLPRSKKRKYMKDNIEKYVELLKKTNFIEKKYK